MLRSRLERPGVPVPGGRSVRAAAVLALALAVSMPAAATATGSRPSSTNRAAGAPYPVSSPRADCPAQGTARDITVADAFAPHGRRALWVYRPAGADSADLPVLYLLHGLPGSSDDFYDSGLAGDVDRAICAGAAPFVVAAIDGSGPGGIDTEWGDDAQHRFGLESLVTGRLVAAVEGAHHRTRQHRAIGGFSMGGYGAVTLAERHPELYGSVASLDGYFHIDDPDGVFGDSSAAHDPGVLAPRARSLRVYLGVGDRDTVPGIAGETQRYGQLLADEHHPHLEEVVVHGDHSLATARRLFPSLLRFLETGWR